MNWNENRSIRLSRACVVAFMVLLAAADIGGIWIGPWYAARSHVARFRENKELFVAIIYGLSVFGWVLLAGLFRLLRNMRGGIVFDQANVKELRRTSWCCFGVCACCLLSAGLYLPFLVIAIAAGFVGLIVRIVKNTFEQAILMKDELDFTV